MPTSALRSPPTCRSTSATRAVRGSAAATKTPTAWSASTYQEEPTSRASHRPISTRLPCDSINVRERPWASKPQPISYKRCCTDRLNSQLLFVLVILRHERRRLISLNVTANPTAEWIAHQITDAFPWSEAPDYLIRDRDASYGHAVTKRLAAMGIRDHPTAARLPWQNGYAERLIGSIRRECLDHAVVFGEAHLRRILAAHASYYNAFRTHLSLGKDSPAHRPIQQLGQLAARPILSGLHHHYYRI